MFKGDGGCHHSDPNNPVRLKGRPWPSAYGKSRTHARTPGEVRSKPCPATYRVWPASGSTTHELERPCALSVTSSHEPNAALVCSGAARRCRVDPSSSQTPRTPRAWHGLCGQWPAGRPVELPTARRLCGRRRRSVDREINRQEHDPEKDKPHRHVDETESLVSTEASQEWKTHPSAACRAPAGPRGTFMHGLCGPSHQANPVMR
jgi:hypothetical protein